MEIIKKYIDAISLVYDQKNSYIHIMDDKNNFLYLSEPMRRLISNGSESFPENFDQLDAKYQDIVDQVKELHKQLFRTGESVKFISIEQVKSGEIMLFRGVKYPIFEEPNKTVAILTIRHHLNLINFESDTSGDNYCFSIPGYDLNYIEQLILFYASLGFSHGESHQFIVNFTDAKLKFENFKYYSKQLLRKFGVQSMKQLISEIEELRVCKFIPRKLLKSSLYLIKN